MVPEEKLAHLKAELDKSIADAEWQKETEQWTAERSPETIGGLLGLLDHYLRGEITLKQFQVTFDKETRTTWDIMGLKGLSSAMFLNTLVKHLPDQTAVDLALKAVLPKPASADDGESKMQALESFVNGWLTSGAVPKTHVQSSRVPFFLSAWWQLQDREEWPVYYSSMRRVYERLGLWKPGRSTVTDDYVAFRATTLELMQELGIACYGVERLGLWFDRATASTTVKPSPVPTTPPPQPEAKPELTSTSASPTEGTAHSQVQWLLAKLGKQLNLKVWIAQNDHQRVWMGEKLGQYSISALPHLGIGDAAQKIVRLIDVIWIKGANQVVAAFEVESTTSIYSGLLRMSDLTVLAPNTNFPIYIIAPAAKLERVRDQLRRPTFQHLELHQRCRFFSIEQFVEKSPAMLEWMNDPAAIDKIAEQIGDLGEDDLPTITEDEEPV